MQFRLNFDDNINAGLIEKILRRADGASPHKALKIMVIEWCALEIAGNTPKPRQETGSIQPNQPNTEDDLSAALDDLEATWELNL